MMSVMTTRTAIHLPTRMTAEQWKTVGRCVLRVLADSNRTEDIALAEELSAQDQLRHLIGSRVMETGEGPALMRDRPHFGDIDFDHLRSLPASTLGGAFARFMDDNGLSTNLYDIPPAHTADPDEAYLILRIRHVHDVWHVLTGLGVEGHDEILLHAFQLAQTGLPSSVALMALGSLKHMALEARFWALRRGLRAAFLRGRAASPLLPVYWERHFEEPLAEVRARHGIRPWTARDVEASGRWRWAGPAAA